MDLDKLAVRISRALLVTRRDSAAGTDHRVRRFAEDETWTTGRNDHCVSRKRFQLERLQVHRDQSATDLMVVEHERQHFPVFKLPDFPVHFVTSNLFVERVKQLLSGRGSGERGAVMFGAAKTAEVEQSFTRAREGHTHAIEKIDDRWRHLAHRFRGWLVCEKVAAVNGVVKVFPG